MNRVSGSAVSIFRTLSKEQTGLLQLLREQRYQETHRISTCHREYRDGRFLAPASWSQQRLWFVDRLEGSAAYHVDLAFRLHGALDPDILQKALDAIARRHEILRTVIINVGDEPTQEIAQHGSFELSTIDLSALDASECEAEVRRQREANAQSSFDLSKGPLIRARLLGLRAQEHVILIAVHHIVFDGWSIGVLLRELSDLYAAYGEGRDDPLPPPPIQYADYARWQRHSLQRDGLQKLLDYWRARLEGAACHPGLPTDYPRPARPTHRGGLVPLRVGAELSSRLKDLAHRYEATLFMVLYAAWSILISRLSGHEDVSIGTPVANRQRPELESLIGFFANTLVLRTQVRAEERLSDFLKRVKEVTLGAYEHQDIPFEKLVEALRPHRDMGRSPFFQVVFALQNTPETEWRLPGAKVTCEPATSEPAMFDLLISLSEVNDGIVGNLGYASDLFDHETVTSWAGCFATLLCEITTKADCYLGELNVVSGAELRQVVEVFNATAAWYPRESSIQEIFEEQVERTPEATAVIFDQQELTYVELNCRANRLARYLKRAGVGPGDYVPILMSRSLQMLIAQLAVLKSGAAYMPVDTDLPAERRTFMVRDCGARWILADTDMVLEPEPGSAQWLDCVSTAEAIAKLPSDNIGLKVPALHPAYVMYTSGSTGIPKGVVVPHRAVNRLAVNNGYAEIGPSDCVAHCSNPAFDASTFEIWVALLNGASVLIVPRQVVSEVTSFALILKRHQVTALWMTSGLFTQYSEALAEVFPQLNYLLVGGDVVDVQAVRRVLRNSAPKNVLNGYGPTECTTFSTTYLIRNIAENARSIPIGRPISNTQVYILDAQLRPLPLGVAGEIYIGGDGVASGYLNRPELSAERFVGNPFSQDAQSALYRSGDLGRWRPGGIVEYIGRNDQQVKLRGFRIELGEIEAHLVRHPLVKETVVVAREDSPRGKHLVAYVIPVDRHSKACGLIAESLRTHLKNSIPLYMVPSAFVILEQLPLTSNGKVDRGALPLPETQAYASREYEPPRGEVEGRLAGIWQQLLGLERVGRADSFFELGGHSLLVLKALSLINQSFGTALSAVELYRNPTVQDLGASIEGRVSTEAIVDLSKEAALDEEIMVRSGRSSGPAKTILLTGATGFVGRFLLAQLLHDTDAFVYCMVRGVSTSQAQERLRQVLLEWNLWEPDFAGRMLAVAGDLKRPALGLDEPTYQILCRDVDCIYHCATSMNHLETYAMAKAVNVESVKELLRLATQAKPKQINYISTLSVFSLSRTDSDRVLDEDSRIDFERHSIFQGYAASKWVGEKIVMMGAERGIPANIFRLGLVWADARHGRYDELQREYRLFKSCLLSGFGIRGYRYDMAPTPVDYVARSVVSLATRYFEGGEVFHISAVDQMGGGIFERCNEIAGTSLELLSFYDWICQMKRLQLEGRALPIVPLIEFAFSMDEESFYKYQRDNAIARLSFSCARTHRDLAPDGIVAPVFDDQMLQVSLKGMFSRDIDVRCAAGYRTCQV